MKMETLNKGLWTELDIEELEERIERMVSPACIPFLGMMCGGGCYCGLYIPPCLPNPGVL